MIRNKTKLTGWWTIFFSLDVLQDHRIASCKPSEKLRDSHSE